MRVIAVCNYKGGTGKTTSSVFIAHGLAHRGHGVVFIDADTSRRRGTASIWGERVGFPFTMLGGIAGPTIHQRLPQQKLPPGTEFVVIDTPPLEEERGVVFSAIRAATDVVVPLAPTSADLDDLPGLWAAVEDSTAYRDAPPRVAHLFTSAPQHPRASSPLIYREHLESNGHWVLAERVPFRELYAQATAAPVRQLGAYAGVVAELLSRDEEGSNDGTV